MNTTKHPCINASKSQTHDECKLQVVTLKINKIKCQPLLHCQTSTSSPSASHTRKQIFLKPRNISNWQVHTEQLMNDTSTFNKEDYASIKTTFVPKCHQCLWLWYFMKDITHKHFQKVSNRIIFLLRQCFCISPSEEDQHLWPLWSRTSLQSSTGSLSGCRSDTCSWGSASNTAKPLRSEGGWQIHSASQQARLWKESLAVWSALLADSLHWIAKSP